MNKLELMDALMKIKDGSLLPEDLVKQIQRAPFEDIGIAKLDHHRAIRQGTPEIIYGRSKTTDQLRLIVEKMIAAGSDDILITGLSEEAADVLEPLFLMEYHPLARVGVVNPKQDRSQVGMIVIASGGTSDQAVCEEATITAEVLGNKVVRLYDVGVAGLHRLLAYHDILLEARVVIAVAGMEGALASVIGGLVSCPVIAVPTSVGYGANFGGLAALLAMLNSCSSGTTVVNIDNGFGAGFAASRINQMEGLK